MGKFTVITDHPIATESRDTTHPGGAANDNSRNHAFNDRLYHWLSMRPIRLMDIGCSGGAFVRDCLEDGHLAIGLEGSDYSLVRKRAEWATIPDNLFTCDVTKPFEVLEDGKLAIFNIISAWEVMEHIKEEDLTGLCQNVRRHLHRDGYWIMSVSEQQGEHHVCVHGPEWWKNLMGRGGFENVSERVTYFGDDWIRGPKQNAPQSFHLILKAKP